MIYRLEITALSGVSAGDIFRFTLEDGQSILIGRADTNDIVLSDKRVSRNHVRLTGKQDGLYIQDLGSASGTIHMGFQLGADQNDGRRLSDGDEFKIADLLFRVSVSGDTGTSNEVTGDNHDAGDVAGSLPRMSSRKLLPMPQKNSHRIVVMLLGVLAILLLWPSGPTKKRIPKQRSHIVLDMPEYSVLGYMPGKRRTPAKRKDVSRLDKVQFNVPSSHALIEYDYKSEAPVDVFVDKQRIATIPPFTGGWSRREIIVRDVLEGKKRRLVFDNLSYPKQKGKKQKGALKRWAVRHVRATPISPTEDFDALLEMTIARTEAYDKTPDGLFLLTRSLQRLILELLIERKDDVFSVPIVEKDEISPEMLSSVVLRETLEAIARERSKPDLDVSASSYHLSELGKALGHLQAELWRRVQGNFRRAIYAAKAENSIVALDNLLAVKIMIPDESDYRWVRAERLINNDRYVPRKVRRRPDKYR